MSGFENLVKVAAVASALGGAAEGVRAQEMLDESDKNAVMNEVLPVLEEGNMKSIGEGKYQMEHNGVLLEITIPTVKAYASESADTIVVEEKQMKVDALNETAETIQVNEQKVIVGAPKL